MRSELGCLSTNTKMPIKLRTPESPEEIANEIEVLLGILREHQKKKETVLDPIFFQRAEYYPTVINMKLRDPADPPFNATMEELCTAHAKIMKTKTKEPTPYIMMFEAIIAYVSPAKICVDCGGKYHPMPEQWEKRTRCTYCM